MKDYLCCQINLFSMDQPFILYNKQSNTWRQVSSSRLEDIAMAACELSNLYGVDTIKLVGPGSYLDPLVYDIYAYNAQTYKNNNLTVLINAEESDPLG